MKRSLALVLTTALSIGVGGFIGIAHADDAKATKQQDTSAQTESASQKTKVWDEGFAAMRAMHDARVAIFNGEPDLAKKLMESATTNLNAAIHDEGTLKDKTDLVAIDGALALADTFVPSQEKAEHIAKANEHFKNGDKEKGIRQLKLGEIEVSFSRVLMPLQATKKRLADAVNLANDHKYYEANLALKAAEDGLTFDTISLTQPPKDRAAKKTSKNADTKAVKKTLPAKQPVEKASENKK